MTNSTRSPAIAQRLVSAYITTLRQHLPTSSIRQLDQLPAASEHQLARLQRAYPGAPVELTAVLARVNGTCWEALKTPPGTTTDATAAAANSASPASPANAATTAGRGASAQPTLTATAASYLRATFTGSTGACGKKRVKVAVPILGSALGACPYYLMSVDQMLAAKPFLPPPWKNGPRQPAYSDALSEGEPDRGQSQDATATGSGRALSQESRDTRSPYTIANLYEGYRIIQDLATASAAAAATAATVAAGANNSSNTNTSSHNVSSAATTTTATGTAAVPPPAGTPAAPQATTASQKIQKIISGEVGLNQASGASGGSLVPPIPTPAPSSAQQVQTPGSASTATTTSVGASASNAAATPAAAAAGTASGSSLDTSVTAATSSSVAANAASSSSSQQQQNQSTSSSTTAAGSADPAAAGMNHWVYVDPRIDIRADLNHWLGFADSIYPHHQREVEVKQQLKSLLSAAGAGGAPDAAQKANSSAAAQAPLPLYKTCESRLFVDFSPSEAGVSGQIVQFVRGGQRTTKKRLSLFLRENEEVECTEAPGTDGAAAGTAVTVGECDSFVVIAPDFGEYLKLLIREEYEFTEDLEDEEDEEDDDDDVPAAGTVKK